MPAHEILERIDAVFPLERRRPRRTHGAHVEPAARVPLRRRHRRRRRDRRASPSRSASSCDRVRITAEGKFRTCLFALDETDLRAVLRGDAPDAELDDRLAAAIAGAVGTKWAGHRIGQVDFIRPDRSMSQIGG